MKPEDDPLEIIEARVLGVLIEKELTTPDVYPLTMNTLINACNQKSNRHPVMALDEMAVDVGASNLRQRGMLVKVMADDARVPKYRQTWTRQEGLTRPQTALMAELLLRGPQTVGELRTRASRMVAFQDLAQVEQELAQLGEREFPLVGLLPRQVGMKERRYAHLLSGVPEISAEEDAAPTVGSSNLEVIRRLEVEITALRREVNDLREAFEAFRKQFQ